MTLRVLLVWPESSDGKPLEPEKPGWVVGWKLDDATVVCAGILSMERDDIHDTRMIVGRWEPMEVFSSKNSSVPCFAPGDDGPWWRRDEPAAAQQQLLLYRPGIFYQYDTPWMAGLFPRLLWHLNDAGDVVERLEQGKSVSVCYKDRVQNASNTPPFIEEENGMDGEQPSLPGRLRRFVAKQSMIALHWKAIEGFFDCLPVIQLFWLLSRNDEKTNVMQASSRDHVDAYIERFNQALSLVLNIILGILVGFLLLHKTDDTLEYLQQVWRVCYEELVRENIQWLETFPAGFKLNVPLTQNMGREITMLIGVHDSICDMLWSFVSKVFVVQAVGVASIVFGFTALVALLHDILVLTTLHIAIVSTCFRTMHRTELYLLASLWRLFRGRKKNILRHRTDTMEYDSMQLLLGMILFTAVLFLFTTVLVYYAFFEVLYLAIQSVGVIIWLLYVTVRFLPLGMCMLRLRHPGWFTEKVFLEDFMSKKRIVTRLAPVYRSFVSILVSPLARYFTVVLSSLPELVGQFLTGKPCTIRDVCLSSSRDSMKY